MIRARLFKGLKNGTMNIKSIFDDEKIKIQTGQVCNYCGAGMDLALEHIFPQKRGGKDDAENLILSCRSCNSKKGTKDLMEWMNQRGKFLPLMVIRRYMKLVYSYCVEHDLLEKPLDEVAKMALPFKIEFMPAHFPKPNEMMLNAEELVPVDSNDNK